MSLKKKEVLQFLPEVKTLRKDILEKSRKSDKLLKEAEKAREIVEALDGVVLYNDFPIKVGKLSNCTEIVSGCFEVKRSAYVKPHGEPNKFVVTCYLNTGNEVDGTPIEGVFSRSTALQHAKNFVATGQKMKKKK